MIDALLCVVLAPWAFASFALVMAFVLAVTSMALDGDR